MQIYEQIPKVMAEVGAIGKDDKNPQQGYKYRGIDAVMNALHPAMVKHKIFAVPTEMEELNREERQSTKGGILKYSVIRVKYRIYAEDGSYIESEVIGEGMDSGDKSVNKAMSVAFKYACFQTFCIPTEEMIDPEIDSPTPTVKVPAMAGTVTEENKNDKICAVDLNRATRFMTDVKVLAYVLKSYNVANLSELTNEQYAKILRNWDKYVQKAYE